MEPLTRQAQPRSEYCRDLQLHPNVIAGGGGGAAKRRTRDLRNAVTLRPREVYELYGIPPSTVSDLCRHPDPERRLPSTYIPGRGGRKGMRLVPHDGLVQWLEKWKQ